MAPFVGFSGAEKPRRLKSSVPVSVRIPTYLPSTYMQRGWLVGGLDWRSWRGEGEGLTSCLEHYLHVTTHSLRYVSTFRVLQLVT